MGQRGRRGPSRRAEWLVWTARRSPLLTGAYGRTHSVGRSGFGIVRECSGDFEQVGTAGRAGVFRKGTALLLGVLLSLSLSLSFEPCVIQRLLLGSLLLTLLNLLPHSIDHSLRGMKIAVNEAVNYFVLTASSTKEVHALGLNLALTLFGRFHNRG